MMKSMALSALVTVALGAIPLLLLGCLDATESENAAGDAAGHSSEETHVHPHTHPHEVPLTYLNMNGTFEMDPVQAATRNDPRNPSRVALATTDVPATETRMAFYAHDDREELVANCMYQYAGSFPDPHYFPSESKTSIWDAFELTREISGPCSDYSAVISRSPHGDPAHMHLRYGKNVDSLLAMSLEEADSLNHNPWWSLYCEAGRTTTCE